MHILPFMVAVSVVASVTTRKTDSSGWRHRTGGNFTAGFHEAHASELLDKPMSMKIQSRTENS